MTDCEDVVRGRNLDDLAQLLSDVRRLSRTLNAILEEDGLREELWRIMHALDRCQGMSMGEIAVSLVLPAATTTRFVDELSNAGIVFRRPAPDDGRKAVVHLSRLGRARLERVEALLAGRLLNSTPIVS